MAASLYGDAFLDRYHSQNDSSNYIIPFSTRAAFWKNRDSQFFHSANFVKNVPFLDIVCVMILRCIFDHNGVLIFKKIVHDKSPKDIPALQECDIDN